MMYVDLHLKGLVPFCTTIVDWKIKQAEER